MLTSTSQAAVMLSLEIQMGKAKLVPIEKLGALVKQMRG